MGIDTKITRQLDNNYVQVDVTSKKTEPRYFKVPAQKADSFAKNYKKTDKRISYLTNTAFVVSTFAGCIGANMLTKNMANKTLKFVLCTAAGIGGAIASIFATSSYIESQQDKLMKTHQAKEIYYKA